MKTIARQVPLKQYKLYTLICMFYICTLLATAIITPRVIHFGSFIEPGGILLFPSTYFFGDIISEVYGYYAARRMIWFGIICQFIFAFMLKLTLQVPHAEFWHHEKAFELVLNPVLRFFISITIADLVSSFVNVQIISHWKVFMKGKHFWLRALGATTIGEFIFSIIALFAIFVGGIPMDKVIAIIFHAYLFKLAYGLLAIIPAIFIVKFLKKFEAIDVYDHNVIYNPFKIFNEEYR